MTEAVKSGVIADSNTKYAVAKEAFQTKSDLLEQRLCEWCPDYAVAKQHETDHDWYLAFMCYKRIEYDIAGNDFKFNSTDKFGWFANIVETDRDFAREQIKRDILYRNFASPLEFIQHAAVALGVDFTKSTEFTNSVESWATDLEYDLSSRTRLRFYVSLAYPTTDTPPGFRELLTGKSLVDAKISDFGVHAAKVEYDIELTVSDQEIDRFFIRLNLDPKGEINEVKIHGKHSLVNEDQFKDCKGKDYRAYVHRMLSIFAGAGKSQESLPDFVPFSQERLVTSWTARANAKDPLEYMRDVLDGATEVVEEVNNNGEYRIVRLRNNQGDSLMIRLARFLNCGTDRRRLRTDAFRDTHTLKDFSLCKSHLFDLNVYSPGLEFYINRKDVRKAAHCFRLVYNSALKGNYYVFRSMSRSALGMASGRTTEPFNKVIDEVMGLFLGAPTAKKTKIYYWTGDLVHAISDPLVYLRKFFQVAESFEGVDSVPEKHGDDGDCVEVRKQYTIGNGENQRRLEVSVSTDSTENTRNVIKKISLQKQSLTDIGELLDDPLLEEDVALSVTCNIGKDREYCVWIAKNEGEWMTSTFNNKPSVMGLGFKRQIDDVINCFLLDEHKPNLSTSSDFKDSQADSKQEPATDLAPLFNTLFTPSEVKDLEAKAKLSSRKWASVPRLNIGPTKIPAPGQKNLDDDYLLNGAPLLVERLAALGSMSREDAEALVIHKLTNYFIHNTKFQHSRERAADIVGKLKNCSVTETKCGA